MGHQWYGERRDTSREALWLYAGLLALEGDVESFEREIRDCDREIVGTAPSVRDEDNFSAQANALHATVGGPSAADVGRESYQQERWWRNRKRVVALADVRHQTDLVRRGERLALETV